MITISNPSACVSEYCEGFSTTYPALGIFHKAARMLVNTYETIVFEDLSVYHMMKRPKPKRDENGKYLPKWAGRSLREPASSGTFQGAIA
jgi:hypothetical protein